MAAVLSPAKYPAPQGNGKLVKLPLTGMGISEIYVVEGIFQLFPGVRTLRIMCVLKLTNGELTLIGAMRLDEETEKELLELGKITNVVRMSTHHGLDDLYYAERFEPIMWAFSPTASGGEPCKAWGAGRTVNYTEFSENGPIPAHLPGVVFFRIPIASTWGVDCLFYFPGMKLLIVSDYFLSLKGTHGTKLSDINIGMISSIVTHSFGFAGTLITSPKYLGLFNKIDDAYEFNGKLMDLDWDNVITLHGKPVIGNAKAIRRDFIKNKKWPVIAHTIGKHDSARSCE
jgi:hypothetical protein